MGTGDLGTEPTCVECGAALPGGARFCPSCGTPSSSAPVRETRKTVTLLFTDVTGSTAIGEQLDPETYRGVMTRYFTVAREAVERHGGTVEKFVGDAVLAVFGIPDAREDDALRAVRAAAELNRAIAALSAELERSHDVTLSVRTGVNTGSVVVGSARAGGAFATGDAVNTAARLEQAAPPGSVLIGAQTHALVRHAVDSVAVDPVPARGKAEPVPAYRLVDVHEDEDGRRQRWDAPLIGREPETRALTDVLERTVAGSKAHLVTILGAPGLGKTRLVEDFLGSVRDRVEVVSGRCVSYGQGIAYWPAVQLLRQGLRLSGGESPEVTRHAVEQVMAGEPGAADVADVLLALFGKDAGTTEAGNDQIRWAAARLLERLAARGPLVVTVDDLHWADPQLLALLDHVLEEAADLPLLLVCQARPELRDTRPEWGQGVVNALTLGLDPFTPEQTGTSLASLVGNGLTTEFVAAVADWSGGNPLFVEELVAHLAEQDLIGQRSGDLPAALGRAGMPPTITAVLAARLDQLPADERALVERVAVVGLEFEVADALALVDESLRDPDRVAGLLGRLARRDLLRRVRSSERPTWAFKHVLIRDAAYDALPKALRTELHERFADRLGDDEGAATGEQAAFVAHHLEQAAQYAHELAPHGTGVEERAVRAGQQLIRAADVALDRGDALTAVGFLERALSLPVSPTLRRDLLFRLLECQDDLSLMDGLARTLASLEASIEADPSELDRLLLAAFQLIAAVGRSDDVDVGALTELSASAARLARAAGDDRRLVLALIAQARAVTMRAAWTEVEGLAAEIDAKGNQYHRMIAQVLRGVALSRGASPISLSIAHVERGLAVLGQSPRRLGRLRLVRASLLTALKGSEVRAGFEQALHQFDSMLPRDTLFGAERTAVAATFMGDLELALDSMTTVASQRRAQGDKATLSTDLADLASVKLQLDHPLDDLRPVLAEARRHTGRDDVLSMALVTALDGVVASREGDHERAAVLSDQAIRVVDSTDDCWAQADIRVWAGEVAEARGDLPRARALLQEALDRYRLKEFAVPAALAEERLRALTPSGDRPGR